MTPDELKQIAVLRALDDAALSRLSAALEPRDCADGQTIFSEGGPGDGMFFIATGSVRIEVRTDTSGSERKTLTVLTAGDFFGEMALLDQKPRSASALAVGPTRVLFLGKAAFDELQAAQSRAGISVLFAMIRTSSERIRRLSAQLVVYDEVGKAIGTAPDLQGLLDVVLRQLSGATLADWGMLLLRPQFARGLELRALANLKLTPAQREAVADGKGFLTPALTDPKERLIADFDREFPGPAGSRLGFETRSLLWVPIDVGRERLGLIVLGGRAPDQFDLDALNLVKGIARQAGQAILNARHREEDQARSRHAQKFVRF